MFKFCDEEWKLDANTAKGRFIGDIWYTEAWNKIYIFHCKNSFEGGGLRKKLNTLGFELLIQVLSLIQKIYNMLDISRMELEHSEPQTVENYMYHTSVILSTCVSILIMLQYVLILIMILFIWVTVFTSNVCILFFILLFSKCFQLYYHSLLLVEDIWCFRFNLAFLPFVLFSF